MNYKSISKKLNSLNGWQRAWLVAGGFLAIPFIALYFYIVPHPFSGFETVKSEKNLVNYREKIVKNKELECKMIKKNYKNYLVEIEDLEKNIVEKEIEIGNLNSTIKNMQNEQLEIKRKLKKQSIAYQNEPYKKLEVNVLMHNINKINKETYRLQAVEKNIEIQLQNNKKEINRLLSDIDSIKLLIKNKRISSNNIKDVSYCFEINDLLSNAINSYNYAKKEKLTPLYDFIRITFLFCFSYCSVITFMYVSGFSIGWIYKGFRKP